MLLLLIPTIIQMMLLATGCGIIISSLTTKYRDLAMLVSFGVQLWMYASPVAYSATMFSGSRWEALYWCNPMAPIVETVRYAFMGSAAAQFRPVFLLISAGTTLVILTIGVLLFGKVEKTFMDTV